MNQRRRPDLTSVAVLGALAAVLVAHGVFLSCVAEDAYISFRFARNLAGGFGFVWNPGEPPVEGFTNFLWVVICALAHRLGLGLPLFSQVAGVLAALATLPVLRALGRSAGLGEAGSLASCALLVFSGPFAAWSTGGMETSLFTFLLLVGVYLLVSAADSDSWPRPAGGFVCLALASLTRPEGALVFAAAAGVLVVSASGVARRRAALCALLCYVAPCGLYFAWRWRHFGYFLPNTFYAKTGGGLHQYLRGAGYAGYFAFHFVLPLAFVAAPYLWHRAARGVAAPQSATPGARTARRLLAVVLVAYTGYIIWVGGDYMAMYRFFVPVLPIVYLFAGVAADGLFRAGVDSWPAQRAVAGLLACAVAGTFVQSTPLERTLFQKPALQHGTYGGVLTERWHVERLKVLAHFFASRANSPSDGIATQPIGVIGYLTLQPVYGFHGLVDPEIAHGTRTVAPLGQGLPGHEKQDPARALARRPRFFMFNRLLTPAPLEAPSYDSRTNAILQSEYRLVSAWLDDPANGESGYFTWLERKQGDVGDGKR